MLALAAVSVLSAQEPDTLAVPPADQAADTLAQDTLAVDTAVIRIFPLFPGPASRAPGVTAVWDLPDLLANDALTLGGLFQFMPEFDPVRMGFLEGSQAAVAWGRGASSLRYSVDGYEIAPLGGGPLDLRLLSMVEQQELRLFRDAGGYRLISHTYRNEANEPYSRIEAGTGDRDVNLLRGFFSSTFAGTLVGFGFDRIDTDGIPDLDASERTSTWANLAAPLFFDIWGQLEFRNSSTDRTSFPNPKRRDWILRLRRPFADGWFADIVAGTGRVEVDTVLSTGVADSLRVPLVSEAHQVALRGARVADNWQAQLSLRAWDGVDVPNFESEASLEVDIGPATLYGNGHVADWDDFQLGAGYGALRLRLPLGLSLTGEIEEGDRGLFGARPIPWHEFSSKTAGVELQVLGWRLGGRGGSQSVGPSPALGQPYDSATSLAGGSTNVVEGWARGPLFRLFGGQLGAGGSLRTREAGRFFYWPQTSWQANGSYYLLAVGEQLEIWLNAKGGVRGAMAVPDEDAGAGFAALTEELYWFRADAVVRIKDVHVFYNYEYFDSRIGMVGISDLPGLNFPRARTHFGVKWEFWN